MPLFPVEGMILPPDSACQKGECCFFLLKGWRCPEFFLSEKGMLFFPVRKGNAVFPVERMMLSLKFTCQKP